MERDAIATWLVDADCAVGVSLVVLHGSRARGDGARGADWDFGVLGDGSADLAALTSGLASLLGTDDVDVDVVELDRTSALLRYRAARDGVVLLERRPGLFEDFQVRATVFWCDAGPVIRAAQDDVLASLG